MRGRWIVMCMALTASAAPAYADMYTWVDKDGITNVSNEPPPEGVRISKVVRSAPKDPAREAARLAEVRALRERVDALSREVEDARREGVPPPYAAPPAVAFAPPPAPAPTVVVTVVNQPAPQPEVQASGCDYAFGGCGVGFFPGYAYYAPSLPRFHKPQHHRRPQPAASRPATLVPPLIPLPATSQVIGGRRAG